MGKRFKKLCTNDRSENDNTTTNLLKVQTVFLEVLVEHRQERKKKRNEKMKRKKRIEQ